jgi:hypothetical protein
MPHLTKDELSDLKWKWCSIGIAVGSTIWALLDFLFSPLNGVLRNIN